MSDTDEPRIFLRETGRDKTDIVIRLKGFASVVPSDMKKQFARFGLTLPRAFEDVLWGKLKGRQNSTWAELALLGRQAYRQACLQWFRLQYVGHFHPKADAIYKELAEKIESASKVSRIGRRRAIEAEQISLRKRYKQLLPMCCLIHREAERAAQLHNENDAEIARKNRRLAIWQAICTDVHGMPWDGEIFGGDAFKKIPYRNAELHEPDTWKPHQLAISLLAFDRVRAYQTIEKKIVPTKFSLRSREKRPAFNNPK